MQCSMVFIKSYEVLRSGEEKIPCYLDDLPDFFEVEWVSSIVAF